MRREAPQALPAAAGIFSGCRPILADFILFLCAGAKLTESYPDPISIRSCSAMNLRYLYDAVVTPIVECAIRDQSPDEAFHAAACSSGCERARCEKETLACAHEQR